MTNFQLLYAIHHLMTGSHQDDVDVQLYRASLIEQKINERLDRTSDAYVK